MWQRQVYQKPSPAALSYRVKLCRLRQQYHEIFWVGIADHGLTVTSKRKILLSKIWIVAFIPSRISVHFLAALTVRWWSLSSISPPLFISRFSTFNGWNAERCTGLFWWSWMWGLNYRQFISPVSLWNLLFWYSQFWWNEGQHKHNIGSPGGRKAHPSSAHLAISQLFSNLCLVNSLVLSNMSLTVKESTYFSLLTMKLRKELEIHTGHIPSC